MNMEYHAGKPEINRHRRNQVRAVFKTRLCLVTMKRVKPVGRRAEGLVIETV